MCFSAPGSVSSGSIVLLKNSAMLLMLTAASMHVSSDLNKYPSIIPIRVNSVVNMNVIRSVVGNTLNKLCPKK